MCSMFTRLRECVGSEDAEMQMPNENIARWLKNERKQNKITTKAPAPSTKPEI